MLHLLKGGVSTEVIWKFFAQICFFFPIYLIQPLVYIRMDSQIFTLNFGL